ncbi:MAG: 5-(carboxyamino)imidazole ribonucleotide synthase [Synechococcales bacterium]|nr:5-(carboxyamino)imidazole ribonucleotide synthase [Synechococcales bacterium]
MRIGVIGGGQLAWMMGSAAQKLGVSLVVQTPQPTDPAVAVAADVVYGAIADASVTATLARRCDLITFENEFVNLAALAPLAAQGVTFYPSLASLTPLLDKYDQRCCLRSLGLPTPRFMPIRGDRLPMPLMADDWQPTFPAVLKARRLGYDGQGTHVVQSQADLVAIATAHPQVEWLLEEFVPFERELAVMAARSPAGEVAVYPVVETQQVDQVCRRVLMLPDLKPGVVEAVTDMAQTVLHELKIVGIVGIELFLTAEGRVLVNELAPRTHNSGHYTLDACPTSQFEQQIRAVAGFPLGDPTPCCDGAVMVNLLGFEESDQDYADRRQRLANLPQTHVYWYGKSSRPGRKLGHVTSLLQARPDQSLRNQAGAIAQTIESIWYGPTG